MSTAFPALFCDGRRLASRPVTLEFPGDGTLRLLDGESARVIPLGEIAVSNRLGHVPRFFRLPDGATLEAPAHDELDAALATTRAPSRLATLLHAFESHSTAAAATTVLLIASVAATLWFGLPALARHVALALPVELERQAGRTAGFFFGQQLGVSRLTDSQYRQATAPLQKLVRAGKPHVSPQLIFREMNVVNAYALPGGTIVVSDSLVRLMLKEKDGPDLLAAVYAHEIAHVERRHGLQLVLRNSAALLVVSTVTGDLSTLTTFSGTLPFLLIQRGYAREFESEADLDAVGLLRAAGIRPSALADALVLLEKDRPVTGPDFTYLSTHPSPDDRVRTLRNAK
ncbi:MAG: M48 family metallopeptidase [Verrucomicrobia bacterium]|nr:M48 family metallopeptidase [Verrucomicrobiota bacterium]